MAKDVTNGIGETLRVSREAQNRSLDEIAAQLCVLASYLKAIEADNVSGVPGFFFYKSFVRQYAIVLGLDPQEFATRLRELAESQDQAEPAPDRGPQMKRAPIRTLDPIVEDTNRLYFQKYPVAYSVAALIAVVIGCSTFYTWWTSPKVAVTNTIQISEPASTQIQNPSAEVPPSDSAQPADETGGGTPRTDSVPAASEAVSTDEPPSPVAAGPDEASASQDVNGLVLNVSATESTWLSIISDGKQIFSGTLHASESKTLTGAEIATLKVGNAAGVEIRWNGKPVPPLGGRGEVRTVRFTPENFQVLTPSGQL
jgi:cytoskeleton protein RodZ